MVPSRPDPIQEPLECGGDTVITWEPSTVGRLKEILAPLRGKGLKMRK